jgi:hypothetical protein
MSTTPCRRNYGTAMRSHVSAMARGSRERAASCQFGWSRELESEGCWERSFFERPIASTRLVQAGIDRRMIGQITNGWYRVNRIRTRHAQPHVLSQEGRGAGAEYRRAAVVARVHACGGGRIRVVARAHGRRLCVAPCTAQQGGVLPSCQRHDDPKYRCSKHGMLALSGQQERSHDASVAKSSKGSGSYHFIPTPNQRLRNSPTRCRKSRNQSSHLPPPRTRTMTRR